MQPSLQFHHNIQSSNLLVNQNNHNFSSSNGQEKKIFYFEKIGANSVHVHLYLVEFNTILT